MYQKLPGTVHALLTFICTIRNLRRTGNFVAGRYRRAALCEGARSLSVPYCPL